MTSKEYKELYEQKLKYVTEYHLNRLQDTLFSSVHLDDPPHDIYTKSASGLYSEMIIVYHINTAELMKACSDLFKLPLKPVINKPVDNIGHWSVKMKKENIAFRNYKATVSYGYRPIWLGFTSKDNIFVIETMLTLLAYDPVKVIYASPTFDLYYTEDHDKDLKLFYKDTIVRPASYYVIDNDRDIPDYIKHTPLYELIENGDVQRLRTSAGLNKNYFLLLIPDTMYTWYGTNYIWAQAIHFIER